MTPYDRGMPVRRSWFHRFSLAATLACIASSVASAELRVLAVRPPAVRGAPLLLPVRVAGSQSRTVEIGIEAVDGKRLGTVRGELLWPVRVTAVSVGRWATPGNPIEIEATRPAGATDAFLAIAVPIDVPPRARLIVGTTRIDPAWRDRAPADTLARIAARVSMLGPQGERDALLSLPDPSLPLERFRFTIGVALRGWAAPTPFDDASPSSIAARAVTELWLTALARIAARSEGTAAEVAEMLVATCSDSTAPAPIAAWIADPVEVSALLSLALDPERSEDAMVEAVVSWLRVRSPLLVWIDDESRGEVVLAMANPTSVEEIVRIQWLAGDEPPLAALVPPTEVVRVRFPRPRCAEIDGVPIPVAGLDMLRVENRGQVRRITTSPGVIGASVGGNSFVAFTPPLDLVTVATGARSAATPIPRTLAALRPRLEGWEIFVEARGFAQSSTLPDPRAIRDAIEIVGPAGASITVRSDGSVDDPTDALEGLGGVRFRTFSDRYRIGFTVPPAWIDRSGGRTIVTLGFRRRLDGVFFDAPLAVVPWREVPRTIDIDILSRE